MLLQSWLRGVESWLIRNRRMRRATRRLPRADRLVSAEVLQVRSLLAANITATLAENSGENESAEEMEQNSTQATTADDASVSSDATKDLIGDREDDLLPIDGGNCIETGFGYVVDASDGVPVEGPSVEPADVPRISLENGVLTIYGTNKNDEIEISASDFNNPNWFSVMTGFVPIGSDGAGYYSVYQAFDPNDVREIHVFGGDGDDHIVKFGDFGTINAVLEGGHGNDILQGDTHDQIEGGDGDDYIVTSDWESVEGEYVRVDAPNDLQDGNYIDWLGGVEPGGDVDGGWLLPPIDRLEPVDPTFAIVEDPNIVDAGDVPVAISPVDEALLEQVKFDEVVDDGSASTTPDEIELNDIQTTGEQETSESVEDIDLVITNFMSPL